MVNIQFSVVVYERPDDLGRGSDEESKKTGDAGKCLACCILGTINREKNKNSLKIIGLFRELLMDFEVFACFFV